MLAPSTCPCGCHPILRPLCLLTIGLTVERCEEIALDVETDAVLSDIGLPYGCGSCTCGCTCTDTTVCCACYTTIYTA